jgi:hypothetical protein
MPKLHVRSCYSRQLPTIVFDDADYIRILQSCIPFPGIAWKKRSQCIFEALSLADKAPFNVEDDIILVWRVVHRSEACE